jgi:3-methylfumaryl-CoA hydratase
MTETIPENLRAAVGSIVTAEDEVTAAPVAGMMAAFGHEDPSPATGDPLPPLWHGLFCTAKLPPARLGADGLAKDEGLLPAAADFPNKLFGGARYEFRLPLRIGDAIRKESEVVSFDLKEGRTGAFIVGLVEHRISNAAGVAVVEQNDIIYRPGTPPSSGGREGGKPAPQPASPGDAVWSRTIAPDPVLMFRHSAVTFNSHRIHYDRDYVRKRGYPGLLVQGTLIARLMMELVSEHRPDFDAASFAFRSGRPIYDDGDFTLGAEPLDGGDIKLWALDAAGNIGMTATVSPKR